MGISIYCLCFTLQLSVSAVLTPLYMDGLPLQLVSNFSTLGGALGNEDDVVIVVSHVQPKIT